MGVITVSIDDDVEKRFREKLEELGNEKGKMGEAISEAVEKWINQKEKREDRLRTIMSEGVNLGKDFEFDREKANER